MESGIVPLEGLYAFVRSNRKHYEAMNLMSPESKPYARLCKEITKQIPESQGFYLWGLFEKKGFWRNVYLGKAGFSKGANLKKRIIEELKDERCCICADVFCRSQLLNLVPKVHLNPSQWKKIRRQWERSLGKAGTTHIVSVQTPHLSNDDVKRIEADLIEGLNAQANLQRPAPPNQVLQKDTTEIFRLFRQQVHKHRPNSKQYPWHGQTLD